MSESDSSSSINDEIKNALPSEWKYKLLKKVMYGSPKKIEICIKVALFSIKEIEAWMEALEEKVQCSYSISNTRKCAGEKVIFKRRLTCQHKTGNKSTYPNLKTGTRNTNCPSRISISLMRIQKKYRGKDPPDPDMPCIIDYVITHNHSSTLSVRYRRVSKSVQNKLRDLFSVGYNASTAHEYIKIELQINNPLNYEELFVNRSICPDRNFCHRSYNFFTREHGSIDYTDKTFLITRVEQYNIEMGEKCAMIEIDQESFVIVLCPPLFKRVHQFIKVSSEIVYMESVNPGDNDDSKTFFMSTNSACGYLPLGVIITSLERSDLILRGLKILQSLVGDTMFYGNREGPQLFVIDDCEAAETALNTLWPQSKVFFCMLHILKSLWKYLLCSKNGINRDEALTYFNQFRQIMIAPTKETCDQLFKEAIIFADKYDNYLKVLKAYWQRKDMWTNAYRHVYLNHNYQNILSLDDSETSSCLIKQSIFHRMRSFNVIQLFDFILTKFVDYNTGRLLDIVKDRALRNMSRNIPVNIDKETIQQINEYLYFVPSLKAGNTNYAVNTEILSCTCLKNNTGYICYHIGWLLPSPPPFQNKIEDADLKEIFYQTATGKRASVEPEHQTSVIISKDNVNDQENNIQNRSRVIEEIIVVGKEVLKLEIIHNGDEIIINADGKHQVPNQNNAGNNSNMRTIRTDREQVISAGKFIINELSKSLNYILEKSPFQVMPALQKLLNKTNSNLDSGDNFILDCEKYVQ
ncbi:uncharacterized protein LOC130450582 [Diorhabda sublineata]|uniref:uncharacterized protein LOC130450582 n=1 Tax=Diorhabda sublineata TaxID=1163346 RepID=UPI0024E06C19|nr:uncharacterized protein LOC130450582 [Diorhabda sublineata]